VRANIEKQISLIAKGEVAFEIVIRRALEEFKQKFINFVSKVRTSS
jgi:hypothetical protein